MGVVRLFATLRKLANDQRSVEVSWTAGEPIGSVIDELVRLNPALDGQIVGEDGAILPYVGIFLNGKNVRHLEGLQTPVNSDTEVAIFPPVAGG